MAKAGAPKGNNNAGKGKAWRDALDKALKQYTDQERSIARGQALARVAQRVVEDALDGNKDAWQEIGNRLDGRPVTPIAGDEDTPLFPNTIEMILVKSSEDKG